MNNLLKQDYSKHSGTVSYEVRRQRATPRIARMRNGDPDRSASL